MSKDAINEYTAMRQAIQSNIDAIRARIDQANALTASIHMVKDKDTKVKLTAQAESLNKSIDHLINETDKLFKQYIELANSVVIV
jgi:prefoldin subunit 5